MTNLPPHQMFNDPLIDGLEDQADFYAEIQAEADSALPFICPCCGELDCDCTEFQRENFPYVLDRIDAEREQAAERDEDQTVIFDAEGVTLVIDGQPLKANVSYSDAVAWRSLLKHLFPNADIEPVWTRVF